MDSVRYCLRGEALKIDAFTGASKRVHGIYYLNPSPKSLLKSKRCKQFVKLKQNIKSPYCPMPQKA